MIYYNQQITIQNKIYKVVKSLKRNKYKIKYFCNAIEGIDKFNPVFRNLFLHNETVYEIFKSLNTKEFVIKEANDERERYNELMNKEERAEYFKQKDREKKEKYKNFEAITDMILGYRNYYNDWFGPVKKKNYLK